MAAWQGSAFLASKGGETMGVLRKKAHSSGKVPLVPQQSALQPCQKPGSPAPCGPETFITIDVETQFSVQKKAGPGPVAWLGLEQCFLFELLLQPGNLSPLLSSSELFHYQVSP